MSESYANSIELSESDSVVKTPSATCPVCQKELSNIQGMSIHHSRVHDGFVYKTKECDECGGTIAKRLSNFNEQSERNFCSQDCRSEWMSEKYSGEDHPRWDGGMVTVKCEICSNMIDRRQSYVEKYDKITCSMECRGELLSQTTNGENNNNYRPEAHSTTTCNYCGKEFEYLNLHRDGIYCSQSCKSKDATGKDAPNWEGGWVDGDYGPNWDEQRDKALDRDDHCCVFCGVLEENALEKTNSPLHVHHRIRKEEFRNEDGSLNYEAANELSNLITLCVKCHGMWEALPVQPVIE